MNRLFVVWFSLALTAACSTDNAPPPPVDSSPSAKSAPVDNPRVADPKKVTRYSGPGA